MKNEISELWRRHIDEKLEALPHGRSFIYFTDSHEGDVYKGESEKGRYECLDLIEYIRSKTGIAKVVYGGDILGVEREIPAARRYNEMFLTDKGGFYDRFGGDAILNFGNHDSNCCAAQYSRKNANGFNDQMKLSELLIPDTDIYEDYIKPMESSGRLAYDELGIGAIREAVERMSVEYLRDKRRKAIGWEDELSDSELREYFTRELTSLFRLHFTYTDDEARIKYIIIDCGANALMQFGALSCGWTEIFSLQYGWLAHELLKTPGGYDIVVSSHMLGGNPTHGSKYLPEFLFSGSTKPVYEILTAFKNRRSAVIPRKVDGQEKHKLFRELEAALLEVYSKADGYADGAVDFSSRGEVGAVMTIAGHWHYDCTFDVTEQMECRAYEGQSIGGGIPAIFTVSESVTRSLGALSDTAPDSTAIDIVTITDSGDIALTRIGHGSSRLILK